jgi:hypothetical protein
MVDENHRLELHMLTQLGSTVDKDKYVFYVTNPDRFSGAWAKLERRLWNALDFGLARRTHELLRFEAEINVLRDNIHEAISSGASGRTRQGLEIMQALMHRAVQTHEEAPGATVQRLSDLISNVSYGQEWEILMRAMFDLISASSDTLSARTKQEVHDFLFRLLHDFCEMSNPHAVRSCLNLILADWSASLSSRMVNGSQDQAYILLRLSEIAEFALPRSGSASFQGFAMSLIADTFIMCAKAAVDRGDAEAATRAITYLRQTFEFDAGDGRGVVFQQRRELGLLILSAWILFRKDKGFSGAEVDRTAGEIQSAISQSNMWNLARRAQESEDESTLGWSSWEGTMSLSRHWFGVATMPTYVNLAALKLASTRPFEPPSPPAENDVTLAHRLYELLRAIRNGDFRNLENELTSVNLENVERKVKTVLDEVAQRRRDMLAKTPLDNARIERFVTTLRDSLVVGSRPRLTRLLVDEATSGTARKIRSRQPVDKWWFVQSDVIAEPEMLARSLAEAIIHEEDEAIVSTILKSRSPVEAQTENIDENLPDWLTSTEDFSLIVTNSWDGFSQLVTSEQLERLAQGDLPKTASGIPVFRLYDDRPPFLAAFLTPRGVRCRVSVPTDEAEARSGYIEDIPILVSVRELAESEVTRFAAETGTSEDDYRAQAVVEVLEELTIEIRDRSYVRVWTLTTEG